MKGFLSVVRESIEKWESRKFKEGLDRKVKLSLYRTLRETVEFKWYLHGTCDAGFRFTVEPLNKGQVGTSTDVRYSEVVLYWGVFAKKPSLCIFICCISFVLHFMTY